MVYQSENHNLPCSNCHNLRLQIFGYTNLYSNLSQATPEHPSSIPLSSLSISRPPAFREDRVNGSRILCSQVRRRCSRTLATRLATRRLVRRNWFKTDLNTNVLCLWDYMCIYIYIDFILHILQLDGYYGIRFYVTYITIG